MTSSGAEVRKKSAAEENVDGGWAWVVLGGASFLSYTISCGQFYNIGSYYVLFLDAFGESHAYTAWIGALLATTFQLAGVASGVVLSRIGARWTPFVGGLLLALSNALLYLAGSVAYTAIVLGILGGVGTLLTCVGDLAAIEHYFDRRLYWATGVMSSGVGLRMAAFGYLVDWLVREYGWRGSLLLLSGVALQICVCAVLVFDGSRRRASTADAGGPLRPVWRDSRFWCLTVASASWNAGAFPLFVCFKDLSRREGLAAVHPAFVASTGVGMIVGRVTGGVVAARLDPLLYYVPVALVGAVAALAMSAATADPAAFCVLGFVFGGVHGNFCVLQWLHVAHVFGKARMAVVWGYVLAVGSFGGVGAPISGYLVDVTQEYWPSLAFATASFGVSGGFTLATYVLHRRRRLGDGASVAEDCVRPCLQSAVVPQPTTVINNSLNTLPE